VVAVDPGGPQLNDVIQTHFNTRAESGAAQVEVTVRRLPCGKGGKCRRKKKLVLGGQ